VGWEQYVLTLQLIIFIQNNEEENLAVWWNLGSAITDCKF
jgi:hypothetical protein